MAKKTNKIGYMEPASYFPKTNTKKKSTAKTNKDKKK